LKSDIFSTALKSLAETKDKSLDNLAVVLHRPRISENIGAAARAMCNMGLSKLVVVAPESFDRDRAYKLATHAAVHVVDAAQFTDTLAEALAPFNWVMGTTARTGGERQRVLRPPQAAEKMASLAHQNQVAILFGPEDRGLTNDEIRLCHDLVHIPTADFSSLNLAQAVMVMCYELFSATLSPPAAQTPRLATRHELDGMFEQVKDILVRICYINPENPDYWLHRIRSFCTRLQLKAGEVSIIRGICRQIDWYAGKRFEDGKKEGTPPCD
jgi:tRNA/rRNA methyltransferase